MKQNIDKVLERDEKLHELDDRAGETRSHGLIRSSDEERSL